MTLALAEVAKNIRTATGNNFSIDKSVILVLLNLIKDKTT
jgi:hypothetical protein